MKRLSAALFIVAVLAGCGSEPEPVVTAGPTMIGPTGFSGTKAADLKKIDHWVQSNYWQGGGTPNMSHVSEIVIINKNPYPICQLEVELTFTYAGDKALTQSAKYMITDLSGVLGMFDGGVVMPRSWSAPKALSIEFTDMKYWRSDSTATLKILQAKQYEPGTDLHNPTHLMGFLHMAKPAAVREAFAKDPGLKTVTSKLGASPLFLALMQPDVEKVKILEEAGFDINQQSASEENAYHYAVFGGPKIIRYLGSKGVKATETGRYGPPTYYALFQDDSSVFAALKEAGVSLEMKDDGDDTALLNAAEIFHWDHVLALCKAGANMKATCGKEKYGLFAHLLEARTHDRLEMARKLIGNVNEKTGDGSNLLMVAVHDNNVSAAEWFIGQGLSPRAKNKVGEDAYSYLTRIEHPVDNANMKAVLDSAPKRSSASKSRRKR